MRENKAVPSQEGWPSGDLEVSYTYFMAIVCFFFSFKGKPMNKGFIYFHFLPEDSSSLSHIPTGKPSGSTGRIRNGFSVKESATPHQGVLPPQEPTQESRATMPRCARWAQEWEADLGNHPEAFLL